MEGCTLNDGKALMVNVLDAPDPPLPLKLGEVEPSAILYKIPDGVVAGIVMV